MSKKRILVVNDSKEVLELIQEILTDAGYDTVVYSYGIHDLNEVKEINPDLLILDYLIGDEPTGWTLLQKLKLDRETAIIPVIICTAAERKMREMEGWLTEKGVEVVFKPFDIDDLLLAVRKMLEGTSRSVEQVLDRAEVHKESGNGRARK
jgi:DNA-binding response OmpR family regulator